MAGRLLFHLDSADGGQDLLGEGDHQPAEQAEEALGALAGVVGLDAHTHLDNAPAQDDDADGLDNVENEVGKAIDDSQRIRASCHGRHRAESQGQHRQGPGKVAPSDAAVQSAGLLMLFHRDFHIQIPPSFQIDNRPEHETHRADRIPQIWWAGSYGHRALRRRPPSA